MHGQSPHTALIKILDNLRCAVMKMPPPVLVEVICESYLNAITAIFSKRCLMNTGVPLKNKMMLLI